MTKGDEFTSLDPIIVDTIVLAPDTATIDEALGLLIEKPVPALNSTSISTLMGEAATLFSLHG